MPTPPKTSAAAIVAAARDLLTERGADALTMHSVADRVGVRSPSLYKHFADRAALLKAVELTVVADLEAAIAGAGLETTDAREALRKMAHAYRRFASESPARYRLLFQLQATGPETETARRRALKPALDRLEELLGDAGLAFVRARVLMSYLHGFASMEAAGSFRFGGDVSAAFEAGVELLLKRR